MSEPTDRNASAISTRIPNAERIEARNSLFRRDLGKAPRASYLTVPGVPDGKPKQFGRGQMVPELDGAVFLSRTVGVLPQLVTTR